MQATAAHWDVARLSHSLDIEAPLDCIGALQLTTPFARRTEQSNEALHCCLGGRSQRHQQAYQHQITLQEQRKYILNLEQLMRAEVKSHQ